MCGRARVSGGGHDLRRQSVPAGLVLRIEWIMPGPDSERVCGVVDIGRDVLAKRLPAAGYVLLARGLLHHLAASGVQRGRVVDAGRNVLAEPMSAAGAMLRRERSVHRWA